MWRFRADSRDPISARSPLELRKQVESGRVKGTDNAEVSAIDGGDLGLEEPPRGCDDGRVDGTEGQIAVRADQLGNAKPVSRANRFGDQVASSQVAEEANLRVSSETRAEQVDDFGDDEFGDEEGSGVRLEQFETGGVMPVVDIDIRVERTGVDDESYRRTSARRISSILSDTSWCPLAPALAA